MSTWYGGKRRWADTVNRYLGYDCPIYTEPFAGSLAVLLQRPPAERETVCDKDGMISNFWRAVRDDPEAVAYYADWPTYHHDLTARRNWLAQWDGTERLFADPDYSDARAAGYWCWCVSNWIGAVSGMLDGGNKRPHVENKASGVGVQVQRGKRPHVKDDPSGMGVQVQRGRMPQVADRAGARGVQVQRGGFTHKGSAPLPGVPIGSGARLLPWMEALAQRLAHVVVLASDWTQCLTDTLLWQTASAAQPTCAIFLDPPYLTEQRTGDLYGAEDGDNPALDSWLWAVDHGDKHRIAYACHLGDFDPPPGWATEVMSMASGNRNRGADKKEDCILFSPACLAEPQLTLWG